MSSAVIPEELAAMVREARHVAVLTGAGISAESGIPTFRDAQTGLWSTFRPEELATPEAFRRNPGLVWDWYAERRRVIATKSPNAGHVALAELARRVERLELFTQNIDGLHAAAGSPSVTELHGNIHRVKCLECECPADAWDDGERPPRCSACGGMLRPDVVWFGELLPAEALQAAWRAAERCDLFLSVGTSNQVEPAASLPWAAAEHGAHVIVVNTDLAGQAAGRGIRHLRGAAGTVLPALVAAAFPEAG